MKRYLILSLLALPLLGARACVDAPIKVDAPVKVEAEASVGKTEATMDPTTNVNPDLWTLAQEIREVRNTVVTKTENVQNIGDPKSLILLMMLMQGVQMLRDFVKDFLGRRRG